MVKDKHTDKTLLIGLFLLAAGALSFMLEYTFYQYSDEDGMLHESFFMPLGFITLILGFLIILTVIFRMI